MPPKDAVVYPLKQRRSLLPFVENTAKVSSYELIINHIKKNGYTVNGFPREVYLEGNFDNNSDKNIVWIIVPIN